MIPRPELESYLHKRVEIPKYTREMAFERYKRQPPGPIALDAVLSRIFKWTGALRPGRRPTTFKIFCYAFYWYFKIFHRVKIYGAKNIPKGGAIIYFNHPGTFDPFLLMIGTTVKGKKPCGAITAWGNGWFADMCEYCFGWLALRNYPRPVQVERMVRQILKNPFFGIAPEGYPHYNDRIEQGQSSIIRVYSVVNSDKDRIPFIPMWLRGSYMYTPKPRFKPGPVEIYIFKPFYIPREMLNTPENGGKTPRELIDFVMLKLAHHIGQKELFPNKLVEMKRENIKKMSADKLKTRFGEE